MSTERLDQLLAAIAGHHQLLILPHNDPDPDAIASAVALRHLLAGKFGVKAQIAYRGIIGRAENRALVRYLGRPLRQLAAADLQPPGPIALVDTQPGAGNNALPPGATAAIVIDHHPWREGSGPPPGRFVDVRPDIGAASTMLTEYLRAAGIEPGPELATALFYGIKSDTMGLGRGASPADAAAYYFLQPHIDVDALTEIERAQVPATYFRSFDATLQAARLYDGVVLVYVGEMIYPDLVAEMADLLLRLEKTQWVVCMGTFKDVLILSVRTRNRKGGAGQLVQTIVGQEGTAGGHGRMAGGQIPLRGRDPEEMARQLGQRILQYLRVPPETVGKPLV